MHHKMAFTRILLVVGALAVASAVQRPTKRHGGSASANKYVPNAMARLPNLEEPDWPPIYEPWACLSQNMEGREGLLEVMRKEFNLGADCPLIDNSWCKDTERYPLPCKSSPGFNLEYITIKCKK